MRIDAFDDIDNGAITVTHGLGQAGVSVWVERDDGTRVAPFVAITLDEDRVEVTPIAGTPVAAIIVEVPSETAGENPR